MWRSASPTRLTIGRRDLLGIDVDVPRIVVDLSARVPAPLVAKVGNSRLRAA
jgi:hypothetical protein